MVSPCSARVLGVKYGESLEGYQTLLQAAAVNTIAIKVDPQMDELSMKGVVELSQK